MSVRTTLIFIGCALATLLAGLVAAAAGYLARRDQSTYAQALTRAAIAFAATLTLLATLITAVKAIST
ncbi:MULTISPECIES: hypothetical protein [Streptomyces]|uniref:DUF4190 domain-containing protein n=1 Tax=Streptomyces nondiastaticus TaxID=3154512 RepID=A0ABW6TT42_9ACTN|nr:hypothetical protein [Streptomyces sp. VNUA116]WKU48134.1 hypothetical protein Q3V23_31035 [Streptomyces sp. VNUA116]